ncbi:MAG TPA: NAD(P)H-dependent oxidoreductase [Pseudorhizobium sp.]|jgi:putative NADPH-quinone reductase|nr:NAD(P)H-dependent oxidoreductase [Pseudorhizobium sp.]
MAKIVIVQGHPDGAERHFCHALADAYALGAQGAGHHVDRIELSQMDVPFLTSQREQEEGAVVPAIAAAQAVIKAADHIVLVHPLWLGEMPALVKAFLEQVARPGFAYDIKKPPFRNGLLSGKSARVVITMGMPAWFYRFAYGSHSLKAMKVGILHFVGIRPVRSTLIGSVAAGGFKGEPWLAKMERLGAAAA